MSNVRQAINFAAVGDVANFQTTLNDAIKEKIVNTLEEKRIEVAQSLIGVKESKELEEMSSRTYDNYITKGLQDVGHSSTPKPKRVENINKAYKKLKQAKHKESLASLSKHVGMHIADQGLLNLHNKFQAYTKGKHFNSENPDHVAIIKDLQNA